jgi:hypothetical protein
VQAANKKAMDDENLVSPQQEENNALEYTPEYATSFLSESYVLSDRNLKNTLRTPELFFARAAMMVNFFNLFALFYEILLYFMSQAGRVRSTKRLPAEFLLISHKLFFVLF